MKNFGLKSAACATALAATISLAATPAASAQSLGSSTPQVPQLPQLSSATTPGEFLGLNPDQAWAHRNELRRQIDNLNNPVVGGPLGDAVDGALEAVFPGLIARKNAEIRAEQERKARERAEQVARERAASEAAARQAEEERRRNSFNRGACPADAKVCVDLAGRRTWLQDGRGNVTHVATSMAPGKPGQETPRGTFYINRKVRDEVSREFGNAPMPYAMYFTNNGHAFHQGNPAYDSAGCVRLPQQDAVKYWNDVNIGDKVVIY
ncbi:L,D-transpeptidase [Corynebacterium lizhenjunii]|uniref:L,D-transpeptidase n=1 Tax=Corynebacterium lizhenjunii TaxID=2709394 RepID=UPI0013E9B760|nr:L,D-transpeptidase [Corynebacterium lizhenjunii]